MQNLLNDLGVTNPEYRTAFDVGGNPVIETISKELGYNPCYFALPTDRGVTFDLTKLNKVENDLQLRKDNAVNIASDVIRFELDRLNANEVQFSFVEDRYVLNFDQLNWKGSAEKIVRTTSNLPDQCGKDSLWNAIKMEI
ncbi:MAG: hypothetical protein JWM44_2070 [Bacilli bacterium]|nr:hypothetical protein [Bacilli bacterium]